MKTETRDLSTQDMAKFLAAVVLTLVIVIGGLTLVYGKRLELTRKNVSQALKVHDFPVPRLESEPRRELVQLRQHENDILTTYGNENGKLRVPIERAMEEMAK